MLDQVESQIPKLSELLSSRPCFPQEPYADMNTITEKELADSAQNGALTVLKVVRYPDPDDDGWCIFASVSWKQGDCLLITQRRKPRLWRNMDRLLRHIEVNYREIKAIAIFFRDGDDEQTTDSQSGVAASTL